MTGPDTSGGATAGTGGASEARASGGHATDAPATNVPTEAGPLSTPRSRRAMLGTFGLALVAVGALVGGVVLGGRLRGSLSPAATGALATPVVAPAPGDNPVGSGITPADSAGLTTGVVEAGRASLGEPAPDFTLETPDGGTLSLADFAGQPVILNFWATWCQPCRVEMPLLQNVHARHADDGLVVLAVDVGEQTSVVKPFLEEHALTFPVALDLNGRVADTYRIFTYPTTYLIDREGRVINIRRGMYANQFDLDQSVSLLLPEVRE